MGNNIPVLICAYNESQNIARLVNQLNDLTYLDQGIEVLVIDDGSTDETGSIAEKSGAQVVRLNRNFGKASAFYYGLQYLSNKPFEIFISLDADLEFVDNHHLQLLSDCLKNPKVHMSIGSVCGAMSPLSGQRAYRFGPISKILRYPYSNFLSAESPIRIGYGLETILNFVISGNIDLYLGGTLPPSVRFVDTNLQCRSNISESSIQHKLKSIREVAIARDLCRALSKSRDFP